MTSRLFVGWSLSTPFQQIAGTDGAKLHQWTWSRTSLSPGVFLHRSGHCAIANYHSGSLSSASIIDQRRGLVTGDIGWCMTFRCKAGFVLQSFLWEYSWVGLRNESSSYKHGKKLWMETCSCFTCMYGSDVLMYYALFSYTVRVCSYYPHAVIQLYLVDSGGLWVEMSATSYQRFLLGDFVGRKSEERLGGVPAEARREERAENGEGPDWPWIGEARQCRGRHRCRTSPRTYCHYWARGLQSFPWGQVICRGAALNEYVFIYLDLHFAT